MDIDILTTLIKQHKSNLNKKNKHFFQQRKHGEESWENVIDPSWNIALFDYRLRPKDEVPVKIVRVKEKLKLSPVIIFRGINGHTNISKLFKESLPLNSATLVYVASARSKDANTEKEEPFADIVNYEPFSNIKFLTDEELGELSSDIAAELGERFGEEETK